MPRRRRGRNVDGFASRAREEPRTRFADRSGRTEGPRGSERHQDQPPRPASRVRALARRMISARPSRANAGIWCSRRSRPNALALSPSSLTGVTTIPDHGSTPSCRLAATRWAGRVLRDASGGAPAVGAARSSSDGRALGLPAGPAERCDAIREAELVLEVLRHSVEPIDEEIGSGTYGLLFRMLASRPEEIRTSTSRPSPPSSAATTATTPN